MSVTNADFKVGIYDKKKENMYDFMIKVPKKESLQKIVDEMFNYLKMLNPVE